MRALIQNYLLCFGMVLFISCSQVRDKSTGIIGIWESNLIDSSDLGLIKYTILFEKNKNFELHIKDDTDDTLSFSGKYTLNENLLSHHTTLGYGLVDGEKVHKEKIDIVQKFEIVSLDSDNLVLREMSDSIEEAVSFQRVKKE